MTPCITTNEMCPVCPHSHQCETYKIWRINRRTRLNEKRNKRKNEKRSDNKWERLSLGRGIKKKRKLF